MHRMQTWFLRGSVTACFVLTSYAHAGGPAYVAGSSYFDPSVKGTPLVWPNNIITYYTDQGDLSPALPKPSADGLVAAAFVHWTNIPTVALTAVQAGELAEDVNGTNVTLTNGVLNLPADIQPTAVATPIAIVYDQDGQVTETLLGTGSSADCFNYAVYGGLDNFTPQGNFAHALVILNGLCAQDSTQLVDFEYRLVRVLGHVLGLDASQANINVWTGIPAATDADRAGFPVMHAVDLHYCVPITICLPAPDQPTMDDRAALSRLYPITAANVANYGNKTFFSATTVRIHGVISFPETSGRDLSPTLGQGMQGVNVVGRWIDPATRQPSRSNVVSSVSGFLYHGNIGNSITGTTDASGQNLDRWGSDDPALQGYFDIAGLEFPDGELTTSYQLTFERIDPDFSEAVGSYAPLQVDPSGSSPPVVLSVYRGSDTEQDIVMTNSAQMPPGVSASQDFANPIAVPGGGEWMSWLDTPGGTNYYFFPAQANRTLSLEVTAIDEQGNPTRNKAQPVLGIWSLAAPQGTPPPSATPDPFNSTLPGLSRLDAQVLTTADFRVGISDWRGDGRPDYAHRVRILYADTITPARASASGSTILQIHGMGFRSGMAVTVGGLAAAVVDFGANHLVLQTPSVLDGMQTVIVSDPTTGGLSTMTAALTVGAGPTDTIQYLPVANPAIPVGGETPYPLPFQVTAPDGTPVAGATVALSTTNGLSLNVCGGAGTCSVFTDGSGEVKVTVGVTEVGPGQVTAQLAPASYPNPSTASATLIGVSAGTRIALFRKQIIVEQGTTVTAPLRARVLNAGVPQPQVQVNFLIDAGHNAFLSANSAVTDADGYASTSVILSPVDDDVEVTACVGSANLPCDQYEIQQVPPSALRLAVISGSQQLIMEGQPPLPVTVAVTDNSSVPNPVFGAPVAFLNVLSRSGTTGPSVTIDDVIMNPISDAIILGSENSLVTSALDGTVFTIPWPTEVIAGEQVNGLATADSGAQIPFLLQVVPAPISTVPAGSISAGRATRASSVTNHPQNQPNAFFGFLTSMFTGFASQPPEADLPSFESDPTAQLPEPKDGLASPSAESPTKRTEKKLSSSLTVDEVAQSPASTARSKNPTPTPCELCAGEACADDRIAK